MGSGITGGPLFIEEEAPMTCLSQGTPVFSGNLMGRRPGWGIETWTSVPTPGFFKMVRQGQLLPHTHYERAYQTVKQSEERFTYTSDDGQSGCSYGGGLYHFPIIGAPTPPEGPNETALLQQAASNFMSKAQFDAGTFLAELRDVKRLFTSVMTAFANATRYGVAHAGSVEDLLSVWLSFRYGLRPLVMDLENFNAALASSKKKKAKKVFTSGKATATTMFSIDGEKHAYMNPYFETEGFMRYTGSVKKIANVSGELNPTRVIFDPAKTAWEYTTYSFVFDWLMNVGNWIDSVRLTESGLAYTASITTVLTYDASLKWTATAKPGWSGSWERRLEMVNFAVVRNPVDGVPIDTVPLNVNFSTAKCIDLMALIYQPICQHARKRWGYVPFSHPYDSSGLHIK